MCFESEDITSALSTGMTLELILDNEWINRNKDVKFLNYELMPSSLNPEQKDKQQI